MMIFKKKFFCIETPERHWKAMRTFDDFIILRNYFTETFPFITVPEIDMK